MKPYVPQPDVPCAKCGTYISPKESMPERQPDGEVLIVCRWGVGCAGPWVPK